MKRTILSIAVVICMVCCLLPFMVSAADTSNDNASYTFTATPSTTTPAAGEEFTIDIALEAGDSTTILNGFQIDITGIDFVNTFEYVSGVEYVEEPAVMSDTISKKDTVENGYVRYLLFKNGALTTNITNIMTITLRVKDGVSNVSASFPVTFKFQVVGDDAQYINDATVALCAHGDTRVEHQDADCATMTDGYDKVICNDCGTEISNTPIAAQHTPGTPVVEVVGDCTTDREVRTYCEVCNALVDEDITAAPGHTKGEWTYDASTDADNDYQYCTVCGEVAGTREHVDFYTPDNEPEFDANGKYNDEIIPGEDDMDSTVYALSITWGAMNFDFYEMSAYWDTTNHKWVQMDGSKAGWYVVDDSNKITLANHSSEAVNVTFIFTANAEYTELAGEFTYDGNVLSAALELEKPAEDTAAKEYVVTFMPTGIIPDTHSNVNYAKIGSITIDIA